MSCISRRFANDEAVGDLLWRGWGELPHLPAPFGLLHWRCVVLLSLVGGFQDAWGIENVLVSAVALKDF